MKLSLFVITIAAGMISLNACKGKVNQVGRSPRETSEQSQAGNNSATASEPGAAPETFSLTAAPETVTLGKSGLVLAKIKNLKAVELSGPDGENKGIELTFDVEVTNKSTIEQGTRAIVYPNHFRLELDNGNKIPPDDYSAVFVSPESTNTSTGNMFKVPAGAVPAALHLFYNDTRVSVKLESQ